MKKGFTLLELLIVIIIIGLLASIGIVQYGKAVANTKNSVAKTTLAEMRKAALAYRSIDGTWPTTTTINVNLDGVVGNEVTFQPPASSDFTWSISAAAGTGTATDRSTSTAVYTWTINFATGALTSS